MKNSKATILFLATCVKLFAGGIISIGLNFDETFDDSLTPPYAGSGSLSYSADTALPDGIYAWDSFVDLTLIMIFPDPNEGIDYIFTDADLNSDPSLVDINIVGSSFYFSSSDPTGTSGGIGEGSADFIADGKMLATEPIFSTTQVSTYRGSTFTYPSYIVREEGTNIIMGNYGAPVPEPGTYALTLGGIFLLYVLIRRRKPRND